MASISFYLGTNFRGNARDSSEYACWENGTLSLPKYISNGETLFDGIQWQKIMKIPNGTFLGYFFSWCVLFGYSIYFLFYGYSFGRLNHKQIDRLTRHFVDLQKRHIQAVVDREDDSSMGQF